MKMEKYEISNRERNHKIKFAREGSSSGKIIRESQTESMYSSAARRRRQVPIVAPSSVEAFQPDKVKSWNALIAINKIWVFACG